MVFDTRVYLCGRVTVERGGRVVTGSALGGRQGRLLFAFLGTRRTHPIGKGQLTDAIWGAHPPPSADTAINALVSKVRAALRRVGVAKPYGVESDGGSYGFAGVSAWVDVDAAANAIDCAEGAVRAGAPRDAWAPANVAATIARQPFLPDEERPWIAAQRVHLQRVWRRAVLVLSVVSVSNGEHQLGIQYASEALSAEPYDETACQALMRAQVAAGNRAEALRVYAGCRKLFRDELGAEPSDQTKAVFLSVLRGE